MPGIVVGVDGSDHSRKALIWALGEAALRHAPLTVLTVAQLATDSWGLSAQHYPADKGTRVHTEEAARKLVDEVVTGLGTEPPVNVTVRAVSGIPADELIRGSADADLLVVGARGAGGFARLMMGSVSTQVSHHAHCPVVIVPPDSAR